MNDKLLEINDGWTINSIYDKIINCEIIKPTYNKKWISSNKLMLDKRKWLIEEFSKAWIFFTDIVKIEWEEYYYGINKTNNTAAIYNSIWDKYSEIPYEEWNPLRIVKWIWWWWKLVKDWTLVENKITKVFEDQWMVNIWITWASAWQYISFIDWNLKWLTVKIDLAWPDYILIHGTNIVWVLPSINDKYYIFTELRDTIVAWWKDWFYISHITDRDDSITNKYIMILWWQSYYNRVYPTWVPEIRYSINIDWHDIVLTTNVLTEIKTLLETELWINYFIEIRKWNLYINKIDWTSITFWEFVSWYLVDFQPLQWDRYQPLWWWLRLNIDWNIVTTFETWTYDTWFWYARPFYYINWNVSWIYYTTTYANELIRYYKKDILESLIPKLPVWYTWKIIYLWWEFKNVDHYRSINFKFWYSSSTLYNIWDEVTYSAKLYRAIQQTIWNVPTNTTYWEEISYTDSTKEFITYNHNARLFIRKNNNTNLSVIIEPYKFYYINIPEWVSTPDTITLTINWVNYTNTLWSAWWHAITLTQQLCIDWYIAVCNEQDPWTADWKIWIQLPHWVTWTITISYWTVYEFDTVYTYNSKSTYSTAISYSDPIIESNINNLNYYWYKILDTPISKPIDIVKFNWVIFAQTETHTYFTRSYLYNNTHFYPLDFKLYKWVKKLIPFGKTLIWIWDENKLITTYLTSIYWIDNVTNYLWNDLEYNWDLFSKYSFIYDEWTLYLLDDTNKVIVLQLNQIDQFSYSVITSELNSNLRWLFDWAEWECFVNKSDSAFNFLVIKDWKTTNHKFDVSLKAWIYNTYNKEIYHIWDKVLTNWIIWTQWWYLDFWEEYNQEINLAIWNLIKFTQAYIIRTILWLNNEFDVDLKLDIEYELGRWNIIYQSIPINNMSIDTDNSYTVDEWELTDMPVDQYQWSILSVQNTINFAWKYIRLNYNSNKRFILWDTYIVQRESKPLVNNILNSN